MLNSSPDLFSSVGLISGTQTKNLLDKSHFLVKIFRRRVLNFVFYGCPFLLMSVVCMGARSGSYNNRFALQMKNCKYICRNQYIKINALNIGDLFLFFSSILWGGVGGKRFEDGAKNQP